MAMPEERSATPVTAEHTRALAQFFLHDPGLFDGAGRLLARAECSVDIPITGSSMGLALPDGSVVRVALGDGELCRTGDVVVFRQHENIVAHRALATAKRHLITRGDARIAPDRPVAFCRVIGRVTGVVVPMDVVAPPATPRRHWLVRMANVFAIGTTVFALRISPGLAERWVAFLTCIERYLAPSRSACRAARA
jgi:hypothetical protein